MFFSSWLRKPNAKPRTSRRTNSTFRPRLEILEGRDVPSTLTVTNNLDDGSSPKGSLRYEIGKAHNGDTIVFAPALDGQTITLRGSELDIAKSLTIQGPGAGLLTISGGREVTSLNGVRVFAVERHTTVTLSGLTITGGGGTAYAAFGYSDGNDNEGGGILNLGTLTVSGCTVSGNYADPNSASSYGGGLYNAGTLTVINTTISGNYATYVSDVGLNPPPTNKGGGIYNAAGATLTISNTTVSGNFAGSAGGGIYNAGTAAALTVLDCTFSSNRPDNIFGAYIDDGGNSFS
jgi:hypothetical protein